MVIVIGDFNAKIGMDNYGYEGFIDGNPSCLRDERERREICGHMCTEQNCHRVQHFHTQNDTQDHMGVT